MVHDDGNIHVIIVFPVFSYPAFPREAAGADHDRRLHEPFLTVNSQKLGLTIRCPNHYQLKRLEIYRCWCQPTTLKNTFQLFFFHWIGFVRPDTVSSSRQFEEIGHMGLLFRLSVQAVSPTPPRKQSGKNQQAETNILGRM